MKKRTTTSILENKKMNTSVFAERRQVINVIYELKKAVPSLPRVEVRITKNSETRPNLAGLGSMKGYVVWIPEKTLKSDILFQVVAHEVLHAVKGAKHDEKCDLMCAVVRPLSKAKALKIFKGYFL
jgi:hypothetical protein